MNSVICAYTYVISVMRDRTNTIDHFLDDGQFWGFAGSSGPSHHISFGSISVVVDFLEILPSRSFSMSGSTDVLGLFIDKSASWPCSKASFSSSFKPAASFSGLEYIPGVAIC